MLDGEVGRAGTTHHKKREATALSHDHTGKSKQQERTTKHMSQTPVQFSFVNSAGFRAVAVIGGVSEE